MAPKAVSKKRKEDDDEVIDLEDEDEDEPQAKKAKKPAAPRVKPPTEVTVDDLGWTCVPPSLLYK
jgi:hypothetical protein